MIVATEADREEAIKLIKSWKLERPMELTAKPFKKGRSLPQNAIAAIWFRERGKQTGHGEEYERLTCKLLYGVPIMLQDEDFAEIWQPYSTLPYEKQLKAMKILDVTSLMSVAQMTEFLYSVENDSYDSGMALTKPQF